MKYEANGKMEKDIKAIEGLQKDIGIRAKNPFGAKTVEELDKNMADMNLVDLQRIAVSSGISGSGNRMVLKAKIRNEFVKFMRGGHGLALATNEKMKLTGKNKKMREAELHGLLMEGF